MPNSSYIPAAGGTPNLAQNIVYRTAINNINLSPTNNIYDKGNIVIGNYNNINTSNTLVVGTSHSIQGNGNVIIGNSHSITGNNNVVIGNNINYVGNDTLYISDDTTIIGINVNTYGGQFNSSYGQTLSGTYNTAGDYYTSVTGSYIFDTINVTDGVSLVGGTPSTTISIDKTGLYSICLNYFRGFINVNYITGLVFFNIKVNSVYNPYANFFFYLDNFVSIGGGDMFLGNTNNVLSQNTMIFLNSGDQVEIDYAYNITGPSYSGSILTLQLLNFLQISFHT
jgi:outer membrane receptor for ferric coprogen and ferric-rhodotorulic acid